MEAAADKVTVAAAEGAAAAWRKEATALEAAADKAAEGGSDEDDRYTTLGLVCGEVWDEGAKCGRGWS